MTTVQWGSTGVGMFVQANQAPVDAQSSVCLVQELTNLYLVVSLD